MAGKVVIARIVGIDLTRSVAIFFAMLSHVWVITAMDRFWSGPSADLLRASMALATPTFILLFGTMLEIVYRPKFILGERRLVTMRLFSRAIQCWLLYCLSVVVLYVLSDDYSLKFSLATMMLLGVTPFTDILKFYAVVLFLAPILLQLRERIGLLPLLFGALVVHAAHPILRGLPSPADFQMSLYAERVVTFLFGVGDAQLGGPSILHGLSLVIAGMVFGRLIAGDRAIDSSMAGSVAKRALFLLAVSVLALTLGALSGRETLFAELGDMSLRMESDPLYFAAGLCGAVALTCLTVIMTQGLSDDKKEKMERFVFFGRTSLFTFAFGNIILYAWTGSAESRSSALLQALSISGIIIVLSYLFDLEMRHGGRLAALVRSLQAKITSFVKILMSLGGPNLEQT